MKLKNLISKDFDYSVHIFKQKINFEIFLEKKMNYKLKLYDINFKFIIMYLSCLI